MCDIAFLQDLKKFIAAAIHVPSAVSDIVFLHHLKNFTATGIQVPLSLCDMALSPYLFFSFFSVKHFSRIYNNLDCLDYSTLILSLY